jgi:cytochrome P450
MAKYAGIPGPEPSLPLGNAGALVTQWPWEACADWGRTYGGLCLIWLAGTPAVVLNDPDLIGRVLDTEWTNYYKRDPHDAVAPVIRPEDLFIANGEPWREKRTSSPLNRDYTAAWLSSQIPNLRAFAAATVDSWIGQDIPDLIEPLRRLAYDLIALAVWGEPLGDASFHDFMTMARTGNTRMQEPPFLQQIPPLNPLFYTARDRWYSAFAERVKKPAPPGSLLDVARRANAWDDETLVQALAPGVFYGGMFSVAAGIAHTLDFLHRDPGYLAETLKELPAAADASEKLDHALRESLRLSPPVALWFRSVDKNKPATLGGHTLPADTMIFITNWLLHRDPAHWADAESWKPQRWAGGGVDRDPPGSGFFFPFGRGPRTCVGQSFAFVLMKVVLAEVLLRSKVQLDLSREQKSDFFFAVQHPKGLKARFEK